MAIKNIDELAKFVKGGAEVLQNAMKSEEEISIEFIDGGFVSDEQLSSLKNDMFSNGKKEGQTIGYDFAMKDIKKDFSIEIEGKDRTKIVEAINSKILADANKKPDAKIQELNASLDNLRNQYSSDISTKDLEIQKLSQRVKTTKVNADLLGHVPEGLTGVNQNQFVTLAKSAYEFDYDDNGALVAKQNGKVKMDKMEKPIAISEILSDFATSNNWTSSGGRGGGHQGGGGSSEFKTMNEVYKHMEQNKINPMSPEGERLIQDFNNSQN